MAFEFISINKIGRENKYQPNYIAKLEFDGVSVECEIYTNAKLKFYDWLPEKYGNSRFCASDCMHARMNGNLSLRVESITRFKIVDTRKIESELREMINREK